MTTDTKMLETIEGFNGLLFIGDPHVACAAPGRRIDDYRASVMAKLREAAELSKALNLVPVILGDLIHRDRENSISLASELMDVLREFSRTPIDLEGNHGKELTKVSDADMEGLLAKAGVLELIRKPGLIQAFTIMGQRVELYGVPFGFDIPGSLDELGADLSVSAYRILITHHDLAFEGAYPGAAVLKAIEGCNLTVNGHMHKTAPAVTTFQTTHWCPGNIEPLSVDVIDHQPAVWEWNPMEGDSLYPHPLVHTRDVFDMTGLQVEAADAASSVAALEMEHSEFADELAAMATDDAHRTSDATVFFEDMEAILAASDADPALRALIKLAVDRMDTSATV